MPKDTPVQLSLPLTQGPDDDQTTTPPESKPAVEQWAASKIAMIGMPKYAKGKRIRRPVMPDTLPKGESDKSEV